MKLPKVKQLRRFLALATERQKIYLAKEAEQPWPWTKDPIMLRHKFCCVYREQDRVTKWIREYWRVPFETHPNLWFAMAVARQINWPGTLHDIGFPDLWEPRTVLKKMGARKRYGEKIFTSAYLIGGGIPKGMSKTSYMVNKVLTPLYKKFSVGTVFHSGATLQSVWEELCGFHGFGKFIAYEVVTDLRHTRYLSGAPDIYTWANAGPGAKRGLNRLYERDLNAPASQEKLLEEMVLITKWVFYNRNLDILPTWEMRDTEHWLCETDKYSRAEERLKTGQIIGLERYRPPGLIRGTE